MVCVSLNPPGLEEYRERKGEAIIVTTLLYVLAAIPLLILCYFVELHATNLPLRFCCRKTFDVQLVYKNG